MSFLHAKFFTSIRSRLAVVVLPTCRGKRVNRSTWEEAYKTQTYGHKLPSQFISGTFVRAPFRSYSLDASARLEKANSQGMISTAQTRSTSYEASSKEVVVLGIESSCDETAAAVVSSSGEILGEAVASQAEIHAQWGGVVPKLAQGEHKKNINRIVNQALEQSGVAVTDLDAIAVTVGPGLSMCLRVGVLKARQLAAEHSLALVPVHHMEAHTLVARLQGGTQGSPAFPFLGLLISGGHNLLVVVRGVGNYSILGGTLDDALGEGYDKVARLLGLDVGAGGGKALEALALEGDPSRFPLTTPMARKKNCDFSFAGLKTGTRLLIEKYVGVDMEPTAENRQTRADIAASFQTAAVRHLQQRTRLALQWAKDTDPDITCLVMAGGVASNQQVRSGLTEVCEEAGLPLVCPPARLCTDNGVMVAWTGIERLNLGIQEPPPSVEQVARETEDFEQIVIKPRWPLGEKDPRGLVNTKGMKQKRLYPSLTMVDLHGELERTT